MPFVYTVISEKLHAITLLGMTNGRLKDYLDLWVLLDRELLNADTLAKAIAATFIRRGTPLPAVLPVGLTDEFATGASRHATWHAFLKKSRIATTPLSDVVSILRAILEPALVQATTFSTAARRNWRATRVFRATGCIPRYQAKATRALPRY